MGKKEPTTPEAEEETRFGEKKVAITHTRPGTTFQSLKIEL